MFIDVVNTACTGDAFMTAKMAVMTQSTPHPSIKRLFGVAKDHGDATPARVAKRMNVSPQTFTNWTSRGLSLEGALQAQLTYGCDANWLLGSATKPQFDPHESRMDMTVLRSAILITERAIQTRRIMINAEARAEITLGAYDLIRENQDMKSAERFVARMLQALGGIASATN